jgi:hypothetical protein
MLYVDILRTGFVSTRVFGERISEARDHWRSEKLAIDFSRFGLDKDSIKEFFSGRERDQHLNLPLKFGFDGKGDFDKEKFFDFIQAKTQGRNGHSSVVPIPAAVWLMISALSLLGWRGRKSGARKPCIDAA